jgi:hypothetical protein
MPLRVRAVQGKGYVENCRLARMMLKVSRTFLRSIHTIQVVSDMPEKPTRIYQELSLPAVLACPSPLQIGAIMFG